MKVFRRHIFHYPTLLFLVALLPGCSTTAHLPDGEQLYLGTTGINYTDKPVKKTAPTDSTGVITAVADAVKSVSQLLEGTSSVEEASADTLASPKSKAQLKKEYEADISAFEAVKAELDAVFAYPPNGAIFGSSSMRSPFVPGLWIYNACLGAKKGVKGWLFKNFSKPPVLISTVSPEMRAKVAQNTLHNYGYFHGKVGYDIQTQSNPKKAKVSYTVRTGKVFRFDSIAYLGYSPTADSLLRSKQGDTYLKSGDPFSVVNLSNEQSRIEKLFRENGYYNYTAAYTTFRADTIRRPGYVQLQVMPVDDLPADADRRYYIGHTFISMRRNITDALDQTSSRRNFTYYYSGKKLPLRPRMWRQAITQRQGDLYRLSEHQTTIEKLGALGVFSQMDVSYVPRDTTAGCDTLDLYVTAQLDKMYDSSFEMNATFKSNQQVGPGVSFGLAKRNAFGGGEKVSFKVFGSYEWQTGQGKTEDNKWLNSYEVGTQLAFDFPRFVFPFINRRRLRFPASTTFSLDGDWRNRAGFFNLVSIGSSVTYNWHKRSNLLHELTLFSLDFDKTMHTTAAFDSIMTANPALYVSMRDQFIPSVSYKYTYVSSPRHKISTWLQLTVKEAGNLTSAIYAIAGKSFSEQNKQLFGNPFAQYIKGTAEIHRGYPLSPNMSFHYRLFAGIIYSYGNSMRAPYADQFYVGGANSVRGFTVRTVGPGSYHSENAKYAYIDQTGDVKLEANAELRARLFGSLYGAVFLDAGNVWLLRADAQRPGAKFRLANLEKIAVGTGAGLRYDLDFLVLRFDVGVALHAPYDTGKSGWYNTPKFSKGLAYHFAIGYPF